MPSTWIVVASVSSQPLRHGGARYEIVEHGTFGRVGKVFHCFDPWLASLAERAKETKQLVSVTWHDDGYGSRVTDIKLLRTGEYAFERALPQDRHLRLVKKETE